MKTLLLKEIRLLLPFWVAALLLAVAPMWLMGLDSKLMGTLSFWFGAGVVVLSLVPFGMEFSHGTFPLLMVQPMPRRRIWLVKLFTLAVALVTVLGLFWLSLRWRVLGTRFEPNLADALYVPAMVVLLGLAGGPWTTLLFRQIAAAIWFTPLVPGVLLLIVGTLTDGFSKEGSLVPCVLALIIYAVLALLWAAWLFQNAQDTQWTGGTISFPLQRLWPARAQTGERAKPPRRWLTLVLKELHLHQAGLVIAGVAALLHVALICARKITGYPTHRLGPTLDLAALLIWFLWLCVPVIFGAVSVAEERKLGTAEGHLCLPVTRRTQFLFKFSVVLLLGEIFGALLPWLLESAGISIGLDSRLIEAGGVGGFELTFLVAVSGLLALISFYASALARNTLQALGIAAMLAIPSLVVFFVAFVEVFFSGFSNQEYWKLVRWVSGPVMLVLLVWLAFLSFRRIHEGRRTWLRGTLALVAAVSAVVGLTAFTFNRTWELAMPLEPKYGPARIGGNGRTKICHAYPDKWFVLLPDGRLWTTPDMLTSEWTAYETWSNTPRVRPSGHEGFYRGSNWVDVAASGNGRVVAMQADGSLWTVFEHNQAILLRIGSATDWVSLAAGGSHLLATKRDGTLWGWGYNSEGQLAAGLPILNPKPVLIGTNTDWVGCFAIDSLSLGVKRDGSVWQWGHWRIRGIDQPVGPIAWGLKIKNVRDFDCWPQCYFLWPPFSLLVSQEGNLWQLRAEEGKSTFDLSCLSDTHEWTQVSTCRESLVILNRDGTLWRVPHTWDGPPGHGGNFHMSQAAKFSRHSDWLAMTTDLWWIAALATDGSFCVWWQPEEPAKEMFLRRSRRYVGSVNIFESGRLEGPP